MTLNSVVGVTAEHLLLGARRLPKKLVVRLLCVRRLSVNISESLHLNQVF